MIHMSNTSNQYADRVFSEHPIALWSLDEHAYYLSLIDDNDRLFSNWTKTNCTSNDNPTLPADSSPFDSNIYSSIIANTSSPVIIKAESSGIFNSANISSDLNTFCVNFFLYQKPDFINWFKVGYSYLDLSSVSHDVLSDEIPPPELASWVNFNNVYTIPTSWTGDIKLIIQVSFKNSSSGDASSRTLIMNGLSVGQESQTTCYESLGNETISLPSSTGITGMFGIPADQYGVLSDNAYYLVRNNRLLSKNDGFPIVFGTDHSTKIYSSDVNLPSFIFPGKGMLNERGRNKYYTLETWLQVDPSTIVAKKILGPISSNDGIYVKEGFITLVVGDEVGSHCVSEWYRPMLMHIELKENNVTVLINGEQVIDIPYDRSTIDLPIDKDWWAIYSYPSVGTFKVDCIGIYPYLVSNIVAKRRFVYGQGTPSIQSIDNGFKGTSTTIDFSTSEYSANIIYPDIARWDAGYFNNLNATKDYISVPDYILPNISLSGRNVQEWYNDNYIVNTLDYPTGNNPKFITFKPNVTYDISGNPISWSTSGTNYTGQAYLNFPSLNILNDSVSAVYGIFEVEDDLPESRTLMSFVNITNGNSFDINIQSDEISYSINGSEIHTEVITIGVEALVGINIESAGINFGYEVSKFFSSPSAIQLYVGGNGINTFEGKIYIVGFSNQTNYEKISTNFQVNGIALAENYEILLDHLASYTLIPEYEYNKLYLDISVSSEWEEYFPLTYFASYVKDNSGNPIYDLDMMQINVGYPSIQSEDIWKYSELATDFVSQDYQDLKDSVYSNYFNLKKNNNTENVISVKNSSLQSFITFQSIASGANAPLSTFTYTKELPVNSVIDPDLENTPLITDKAYLTKFVFSDNVIVYPPKSKNFEDYAMVVHFQINQRSIIKNPLKIKSFEITSKNLNYISSTSEESQRSYVGTKFGSKIYPEIDIFGQIDYKGKNPYLIYKTNTPYMYTTKKSGIRIINQNSIQYPVSVNQYKISIPVNSNGSYNFKTSAIKFSLIGNLSNAEDQIPFLEIKHKNGIIALILNKTSSETDIKAYTKNDLFFINGGDSLTVNGGSSINSFTDTWDGENSDALYTMSVDVTIDSLNQENVVTTYTEFNGLSFYQNGRYVRTPSIKNYEWNDIAILFTDELDFSEYSDGDISLYGGFTFNNISYYLSEGLGIKNDLTVRTWENVLNYESVPRLWSFWSADSKTWQDVYVLGQASSYVSTPKNIYQSYTGTNRDIVDDGYGMKLNQAQASIFTDVSWTSYTEKAV